MSSHGKRSMVWQFFNLTKDNKHVICTVCQKQYKYFKNTTNLKEHLKRIHPATMLSSPICQDTEDDPIVPIPSTSKLHVPPQSFDAESSTNASASIQKRPLTGTIKRAKQLRLVGSSRSNTELTETETTDFNLALIKMIVWDYQPLRIVEDKGFRNFVKLLNPLYSVPSRKMICSRLIPDLYTSEINKLQQKLLSVNHIGVTTDLWTSDSTNHYITVTIHFIQNAELHTSAIQTSEVKGSQTGLQIAAELTEIFSKWNITEKIVTVVSDNGANIKSAINDYLHQHHHPCVAHTLNLTVKDGLGENKQLAIILQKCKNIVSHFKHSALSAEKLANMQTQMNTPQLKIKQDVATRWNSTYTMLQRLIEIKAPITAVMSSLPKAPQMLCADEWLAIEDCLPVLKPFDLMTKSLSGEKYVTLSTIIPLVRGLQYSLNQVTCQSDIGKKLKTDLSGIISRRLSGYEKNKISAKATFLDPRYKKQAFGSKENADNAEKWVLEELGNYIARTAVQVSTADEAETNENTIRTESANVDVDNMLWEYFDKKVAESATVISSSPTAKAILMVKQYLTMPNVPRTSNPLVFWSAHKCAMPELFEMHLKYLCTPATSVPSERVFSKTGMLTNLRRNRLSPKNLDQIVFLNTNLSS